MGLIGFLDWAGLVLVLFAEAGALACGSLVVLAVGGAMRKVWMECCLELWGGMIEKMGMERLLKGFVPWGCGVKTTEEMVKRSYGGGDCDVLCTQAVSSC